MDILPEDESLLAAKSLMEIFEVLNGEVLACFDAVQKNDSQIARRTLVRALFAEIEGVVFRMKQVALETGPQMGVSFTVPEKILLMEQAYELNDRGDAIYQRARIHISRNIKFAFKTYARAGHANYELKVDGSGWDSFKKGLKIRDRLMHPKKADDLIVTDEELSVIRTTFSWFRESQIEVINASLEALERLKAELIAQEKKNEAP